MLSPVWRAAPQLSKRGALPCPSGKFAYLEILLLVIRTHPVPRVHSYLSPPCLLVVSSMVSVGCFPVASTDYRVGRAAPSARWPFCKHSLATWHIPSGMDGP